MQQVESKYDYIIVGAGAAGCVVASRLSEDASKRILLLEGGPPDNHPFIHIPMGMAKLSAMPRFTWEFEARAKKGQNEPPERWWRGKVLGGSSSINGMMYVRGHPADYDDMARRTSEDWSWKHISKSFEELEDHELGLGGARGVGGPLHVTVPDDRTPMTEAMVAAGESMGLYRRRDVNGEENGERVGYAASIIRRGLRQSASVAFLRPAKRRKNLHIVTEALVDKVLFDGKTAIGVRTIRNGKVEDRFGNEIIVCSGTIASPAILQRSGIGDPQLLDSLGIDLVCASPEVGANLQDHRVLTMQWETRDPESQNIQLAGWQLIKNIARYCLFRSGPMSTAPYDMAAYVTVNPEADRPDIQILLGPFSFDRNATRWMLEKRPGMNMNVCPVRPRAKGKVEIASKSPDVQPTIEMDFFSEADDLKDLVAAVRIGRKYVSRKPLCDFVVAETVPGQGYQTDDQIIEAHRKMGMCGLHSVGTCRMGPDEQSVVDPELRVRGVSKLSVLDLSIAPFVLSGATFAPATVLAWRGVDVIRNRAN